MTIIVPATVDGLIMSNKPKIVACRLPVNDLRN